MRVRFGPIYVPPLHVDHNWLAEHATKTANGFGIGKDNRVSALPLNQHKPSIKDHQGSITEMTDASGNIVWQGSYDPYGNVTTLQGTLPLDFMYRGMYHVQRPDLYLAPNGRAYSAKLGRWLNRDPLGEAVGTNLYRYAGNDPINRSDPSGLGPITASTWGAAGAAAGDFGGCVLWLPEGGVGAIHGSWSGAAVGGALGAGLGWLMPDPGSGASQTFCASGSTPSGSDLGPEDQGDPTPIQKIGRA